LFFISSHGYSGTGFPPGLKPAILKISNLDISQYPTVSCEIRFRDYAGISIPLNSDLSLRLHEDEIPITDFTMESSRMIATILLIDTSGSMLGKMEKVADGVSAYLDRLGPDDKTMVMEFNSWRGYTPIVQDFTSDTELIQDQIAKLRPRGQTATYDAIADASDNFFPQYRDASKMIIVLSDGEDNNSVREWFTAVRFAKEHDIRVFFVALGPEADRRTFSRICRETRGKTFVAPTEESLPAAYESVSKNIRARQTVLTYQTDPDVTADGRPHYVQVTVYKDATKWVQSPLRSFKFRILKTAEQLAEDERARHALLRAAEPEQMAPVEKEAGEEEKPEEKPPAETPAEAETGEEVKKEKAPEGEQEPQAEAEPKLDEDVEKDKEKAESDKEAAPEKKEEAEKEKEGE
jgi:uncharacterized protein YegL